MKYNCGTGNKFQYEWEGLTASQLLEADERKGDMYHYDGRDGNACVVYLLKAYVGSDKPNWEAEYIAKGFEPYELEQYALGVYSSGEHRQMKAHAHRHTIRTGEQTGVMETYLTL